MFGISGLEFARAERDAERHLNAAAVHMASSEEEMLRHQQARAEHALRLLGESGASCAALTDASVLPK